MADTMITPLAVSSHTYINSSYYEAILIIRSPCLQMVDPESLVHQC